MRDKPKSEFNKNVITLMTGTTIAQAIPIAISPILTRMYSPEDFGIFAIFIAITTIFGSISNARYELAIMLPVDEDDAINIFALGFIINVIISVFILVLVVLFNDYFVNILNNNSISIWLYFTPLAVFLTGSYNLLNYFNTRKKYFKNISNATILRSITTAIVQLSIGFLKEGASGLINGQLISNLFANINLLKSIFNDKFFFSKISKDKIMHLLKVYKDFPKFSMPAILANTLSIHLTNILISSFFSVITLGFYSLVQRLLGVPSSLIGGAIGQVFFQEAITEKNKTGKAINSFNNIIKKLFLIALPSFIILYFIVEDLFSFIFGEEWRIAGTYAKIVIPLFLMQFIVVPVMIIDTIFEKQKFYLYSQVFYLIMVLSVILLYRFDTFTNMLNMYTILSCIYYLIYLLILHKFSKG